MRTSVILEVIASLIVPSQKCRLKVQTQGTITKKSYFKKPKAKDPKLVLSYTNMEKYLEQNKKNKKNKKKKSKKKKAKRPNSNNYCQYFRPFPKKDKKET